MGFGANALIANLASGGVIVIGVDGTIKTLQEDYVPQPGDIVMQPDGTLTDAEAPAVNVSVAAEDGTLRDVTDDVQKITAAIEEGQDPTQIDEELDPAAGDENGSSGLSLDSVQRTGSELIAQTLFETQGFEGVGLSRTQSLDLIDRIRLLVTEPSSTPTPTPIVEPDTPPLAESFDAELDSNGGAAIVFNDDVNAGNDHISDEEDDPANTPLGVVITSLPESGVLLYDGQALTDEDLTQFDDNGEVIGELKTFDPTLFTYENDDESTGFFLGVKEEPEGFEGDESTTSFLNWGEPVDGDPTQRVLTFEGSDDVIRITAESNNDQPLTQYFGDKNHIGYGLGVGNGDGIQANESIVIDMSERPADSVTLGLDGLGGWFYEAQQANPTSVLITVYLDDGSTIVKEVTKETSGNSDLFKEIEIFASEGQEGAQITSVEVSTIGNGNWELRYFEANPADDSFDYRAVDSDDNVSEERTVSLVEADNAPPIATDDPVAFEVALGQFNGDDWSHPDAQVSGSYQGDDKDITESGVKRGVEGDENGGPGAQIQYNRTDGESEQFRIDLDEPVTEFSFSVSNLYKNEGGSGNHEQGKWVAYFGENAVASGLFIANEGNSNGTYSFDESALGGVAFDSIVFESVDFVNEPSRGSDSSDYFLTGFKASSDGAYVANQGDVLQIPVSELLGNDADPDGDNIRFTHVSDANNANIWIEDGIVYIDLDDEFSGDTHFDYVITDDKGGFDEAKVSIIVNPLPTPVEVESIDLLDTTVVEGDNLVYQVALEDGVLEETRYSIDFGADDDTATDNDVDLSNAQFTNGVTFDSATNEIVVPIGISNFSIVIPTVVDGIYELTEDYTLTIGGVSGEGNIENVDIPQVQVSDDVDVSEGQSAVFTVALTTPTEAPTTINLGISHVTTQSDDISSMVVEFDGENGWETLVVANNGDVTLPAGINEVRVTVPTVDDNNAPIYEGPESFELIASGVVGAQGSDKGVATIFDDGSIDPNGPTPADDDRPVVTDVSEPTVEEGGIATFDVTLSSSSTTPTTMTLNLSEGSATNPADFNGSSVTVKYGATTQVLPVANDGTVQFDLPAGESSFEVLVQTNDDVIVDDNETFNLAAATEYQQNDVDGDATITDDVDPATITLTGPESVMEGAQTGEFTITLADPAKPSGTPLAPVGSIITLSYRYVNADGDDIVEVLQAIVNPDGYTANFTIDTVQDDVYEEGQAFTVSVVSVTDDQNNNIFEALDLSNASQHVLIDDSKDNPPEAEDFDVELDSNGGAAIVFNDDVNAGNDHISDEEDDPANTPLGVVITSLPESGVLLYDGQALTDDDLTQFDDNGEVIGELKTFDPTLFTYENDDESTGFFLGVKEEPEGFEGDESTTSFINWGEPVDGDPTQRVLTFEGSDDVIRITAESNNDQPLTQYFGDKNHVGYGLGVGGGNGIQSNESIVIDMSERPADSVTLGLDGLGGWFYEAQQANPTSVLITVYLDDGSTIVKEVTKETSGNSDLFKEIEIFASEGQEGAQITSVEVSTIGDGNWELRYFEANPADDSFDYRAVDSDDNVSEERTVSLVEADNAPPIATDDPVAFEVALGQFNGDDWSHPDAQVSGSYQGDDKGITESGVKRGVEGDENGGPGAQIQYNRTDGESEQFRIDLDEPVTEFSFSVSNLYKNEGGSGNHEQGKWVAYFGENAVASGLFIANEGNSNGTYSFDESALGGVAFDSIVFESVDFVNEPSRGSDSSDYFLTGFKASSDGAYVANQGDVLQIPVSELLGNDADPDGDNIRFTHVSDANNANIWIEDGIVYIDLDDEFSGDTHFDYVITDDKGGFDEAKVSIIVNPLPTPVEVESIDLLDTTVVEGDNLVYQVALEDGVLEETRYSIDFGADDDTATDNDVDLSTAQFTNGVTFDSATNEIVVPIGISNFSIVIPTVVDGIYELTEDYTLTIGGVSGEGNIENVDIPQVQVSDDVDVSEGQSAVFTVALTTPTEAPTTINLGISHVTTQSDDISSMVVEFDGENGWETLVVANNGDVTLPAGINEVRVTVPTVDDNNAPIYEGPESFELIASGVVGAQGSDKGVATIFDDGSIDPNGPTPADDDRPVVTDVSEPTVEEGGIATFDVTLSSSSTTPTTMTLNLSEGSATNPADFNGSSVTVKYGATTQVLPVANDGTVQFDLPAGESSFEVLVQTNDDVIVDDNETFNLAAATEYQQNDVDGDATITDDVDPATITLTGPESVMEGAQTGEFTITLADPAKPSGTPLAPVGSIITLSYRYVNADGDDIVEVLQAIVNPDGYTANFTIDTVQDDVYEEGQAFTVSVVSVTDDQNNNIFEALDLSNASQHVLIDDSKDNPPEAEDFDVELDSNGGAAIVFNDDVNAGNDHISDEEDDPVNTPLGVVITSLPESGVLLYDGQALTDEDLTQFDDNGEVIGELKTFDPTLFTYENDDESTGFFLGVKEEPEGFEGDRSTTSFLNWGEPVDGDPTQRVLTFEGSDDVIRITAESNNDQPLTQYFGDKNHVGYGLGVGGGNGIQSNESIVIDMSERPADSVTLGLDGLGGWFYEAQQANPTSVLITVYLDDGSTIVKEVTKETSGNSDLFKEIEIFASEGQEGAQITSVEVSTIGNGNWELRYFEANPADDSFDYRAVDSDDNVSEERTVSLVEADNAPPIATDDPVAFEVALGQFNGDDWSHPDAQVSGSYQGDDKDITESGVKRGVEGDENGGPGAQIQYNRTDGESEQFRIDLDEPVTEFSFSVSNLYKNEGGSGNHEQGKWVAYFGENAVASGLFIANEGNSNGTYSFDESALGGVAFDSIVFESVDFVNEPSRGSDSSDYFLTGFKASSDGAYVANQGDVLQIPVSELLGNDADPDGDNIRFTHVSDANNANIWIEDGIVYIDLDDEFSGDTHFDYVITDDKGGFDEAKVSIIVNPLPTPVEVESIDLLDTTVVEGDNLVYQVALEDGVLEETRYSIDFGADDDTATDNDVDLSTAQFTNGVTFDSATNEIVVPIGISNFSIVIPTVVDGIYELTEDYTLTIGGVSGEGNIENIDIPQVQVSDDVDVSEGQSAVFTVSLTTPTEAPTTINLGISHVTTQSDDISSMVVEFDGENGWETLVVANNGDVTLPAGINEVRVTVPTVDDNNAPIYEGPESFELIASGVVGAQGSDKGVATIFDDGSIDPNGPTPADDDRPVVTDVSEPTVEEGGIATFDVSLSSSSTTETTITLTLAEGNATTPEDFDGTELTVQFGSTTQVLSVGNDGTVQFVLPAGESEFDVLVQTTDDNVSDNNEIFMLSAATEYQQGVEEGLATITDNESPTLDLDGGEYQIEFVSESAGYQNVFGYYAYDEASDTQQLVILMEDSHDYKGNVADPVLGQLDSLDNVGYFLIPNAADVISNAPANAEFAMNDAGELLIDGAVVPNQTVFSTHGENSTIRVSEDNDGNTVLSFDDQLGHPRDDDDYNDLVIKVSKLDSNVDYQTTFTEGDDPVSIADLDADIFDDHNRITTMEVTLVNKLDGDTLTLPANTTGFTIGQSVLASSIVLTITADDPDGLSAADFEAFLKQVGFENTSENPDETDRTITVKVTDDAGQESNTATTTVKVIEVSDLDANEDVAGKEDIPIALDITLPADSSVVEIVIKDIPDGAVLASNGNEVSVINGMASLSPSQLDTLTITPPEHSDVDFSLRVEGYTANDTVIEDYIIAVAVEAVTDTPILEVEGADILSFHNFDTIDLDGRSWRGNINSQELTDADVVAGTSDGAEGVWGTDNDRGNKDYHEVGKETVYRGNAGEQGNNVYELEGRSGDDQLFTQFDGEAGQFYSLSFDVAARRLDDSPMTVFLEDSQGNRTILFEYADQQSQAWSTETLNFQTPDDGEYKVVFESETSANSYGALLDDIKLETLDNVGYEDSYIALSDIVVGLVDTDGSESLTTHLDLSAFPSGTVIKAPDGSDLMPDVDGKVDITAWQNDLSELFINVPESGGYPLVVSVSSQDNAPGTEETVNKTINVTVLPVLDAESKQIEIVEDSEHILTLTDFGMTDPDTTLFITHLSDNGQYELQTSLDTWEPISERDRIDGTEIEAGNVRFVPAEHETGYDQYPNAGEGDQYQDYSSLGFILEKGDARSEENTLTIDVSPLADAPTLSIVTPDIVLPEQSFNVYEWADEEITPSFGIGNGVNGEALITHISELEQDQATQSTTDNAQETGSGATPANTAVLVTGLVYLEAGNSYDFTGRADDSLAIKVGGQLVDEARWGVNSGQINGSEFIPPVNGFYPIEIYHHNQSGPGNFDVNVSINGDPAVDLASSTLPVVPDLAALESTDLRTSALQSVEGADVYEVYAYNEGLQDTEIPLSEITTALVDTDNSEALMTALSGLPENATLSDGTGNSITVDASGVVDVTGWNLTQLTVLPPLGDDRDFTITVTSTTKEAFSTSEADSVGTINVVVHENKPTSTESQSQTVDEDSSVSGNVLDSATDPDNVLSITGFTLDNVNYNVGEAVNLASGILLIEDNGDYSFEPNADWSGDLPIITYTTNTGVSDTLAISITPVADEPTVSIVFGESTVNGQGDIETEVDILASVTDLDGSEQIQSVVIQGLPVTATVSVGYQDGTDWILPITGSVSETFDNLVITHPQGTVLDIDVMATSVEALNADTASSMENAASQQDIYADQGGNTPVTLMSLIIDSSGSMTTKPFKNEADNPEKDKTRMELVLEASIEMLNHVNAQEGAEDVLVQLIDFDDQLTDGTDGQSNDNADRSAQSEGWMTVNQAIAMLGSALSSVTDSSYRGVFDPSGYTDYEEAVYGVMNGYDDAALNSVDLTNTNDVIFFLSDGSNNRGWDNTTNDAWDAFIVGKEVTSVGVGRQANIPEDGLKEVAGSGDIVYIPDAKIKTDLPKLRPTIGLPGTLLAMITGMDVEEIVINASSVQVLQEIDVNGDARPPMTVTTRVDIDDLVIETDYGDLRIKEDGSYFFQPDPSAPELSANEAIGYNILYSVLDSNGQESQHLATLNISQSGDVKALSPSFNGSTGDDVIVGTDGDDVILGHQGDDVIDGGLGNDFLFGGDGDDVLIGGLGNDVLTGGAGNDMFVWMNGDLDGGLDVISDFTVNEDKIDISDLLGQNETMDDLFNSISAAVVDDNNVELTIVRDNSTQTIKLDDVVDQLSGIDSGSGNITGNDLTNLLSELIKPQEL